jgi:predicted hydrolase (HD superfamily)
VEEKMRPTIDEAISIIEKYNKEPFHVNHAKVVGYVLGYFAQEYDPDNVEYWHVVGILHDVDFEIDPENHCIRGEELLRENDVDESIIVSAMSHGYGLQPVQYEPTHIMEKILFATDELTGLIGAVILMRPSKSFLDLELSSVKKKFKDKKFAAGCSRDVIREGADRLGWTLEELIEKTILALRNMEENNEYPF